MGAKLKRFKKLSIEEGLSRIQEGWSKTTLNDRPKIYGVKCSLRSLRLHTFKTKGCKCSACGLEGEFFAIECPRGTDGPYHMNLYGRSPEGKEILFTHDHTLARSLGGKDKPENCTTMCEVCNGEKAKKEHKVKAEVVGVSGEERKEVLAKHGLTHVPSRREKLRVAAKKRAEALTEYLKSGGVPTGKIPLNKPLHDPEAEALKQALIESGLHDIEVVE